MSSSSSSANTLHVFYGSATGNAEHIAKELSSRKAPAPFSSIECRPLDKYKEVLEGTLICDPPPESSSLQKHGFIIVVSTTGNGDAPENAGRFMRYIKRKTTVEKMPFRHVAFAVLGLGDTNYDQFCASGKTVDKKLQELGGTRCKPLGMADEATGLEDVVEPWVDTVFGDMVTGCAVSSAESKETLPAAISSAETGNQIKNVANPEENIRILEEVKHSPTNTETGTQAEPSSQDSVQELPITKSVPAQSSSPLFILYGSATGNAEQIAKDLAASCEEKFQTQHYFSSVVCCELDQYKKLKFGDTWEKKPSSKQKHGVIVIVSTTGNGDAPENAGRFIRYIKRKTTIESQPFRHVSFAVLGLGDTNYDKFCASGKLVDAKLRELGGTCCKPLGMADEATGLEDVVEPWVSSVLSDITKACQGECSYTDLSQKPLVVENKEVIFEDTAKRTLIRKGTQSSTDAEEKKMESEVPTSGERPVEKASTDSSGVTAVRKMLSLDISCPLPTVTHKCLPSLGTRLSSCELLHPEMEEEDNRRNSSTRASLGEVDRMTVSSASSTAIHYTLARPFETSIVSARYLTNTSKAPAEQVAKAWKSNKEKRIDEKVTSAVALFRKGFPLDHQDASIAERNGKRVIEMALELPDDYTFEYKPGDSIGLVVSNTPAAVEFVVSMLQSHHNISPLQKILVDGTHRMTVKEVLRNEVDLCSPLKSKRILFSLSQFAENNDEAMVLRLLASKTPTGEELFRSLIEEQRMCFVDVMREFPSCQTISLEGLLGMLPNISPRYYSISSSPLQPCRDLSLTIAFSVVDYLTPPIEGRPRRRVGGVATQWLEVLCAPFLAGQNQSSTLPSDQRTPKLQIFPKPNSEFHLPVARSTPMVLIGPGTGVAPFMGFLSHRQTESLKCTNAATSVSEGTWRGGYEIEADDVAVSKRDARGLNVGVDYNHQQPTGRVELFFGCRHADHDWLYREEMTQMASESEGMKLNLHTAFSRDDPSGRVYVQDLMLKCPEALADVILKENASIYVCGDGNAMGRDVQNAIVNVLSPHLSTEGTLGDGMKEAKKYLEEMKKQRRFLMDIWS